MQSFIKSILKDISVPLKSVASATNIIKYLHDFKSFFKKKLLSFKQAEMQVAKHRLEKNQ